MKPMMLCLLLALVCYGACKKNDTTATPVPDGFSFGRYGGFVGGSDSYYIQNGILYGQDSLPVQQAGKYAFAAHLAAGLPSYFLQHPDSNWRCNYCMDNPVLLIGWKKDTVSYHWTIDETIPDQLPAPVAAYATQINATLDSLAK